MFTRLQRLGTTSRLGLLNGNLCAARCLSGKANTEDWSEINNVIKELRNISREHGLEGDMPDTKTLKELGYADLVMAIRKKHGGIVAVAEKMGTRKDEQVVEMHKKLSARARRRQKRQIKLKQHDFY